MPRSKIARNFGLVGIAVGLLWMLLFFLDYKYTFFGLPTVEQARNMGNYSAPRAYRILHSMVFWFVPGIWLSFFGMDMGTVANVVIWLIAILLNFPIYYFLGMVFSAATTRLRKQHS